VSLLSALLRLGYAQRIWHADTVTDPTWSDAPDSDAQPQQPPGYPSDQQYPLTAAPSDSWAPDGRHPVTGLAYSDKSKTMVNDPQGRPLRDGT
jgi:hypothetical protein